MNFFSRNKPIFLFGGLTALVLLAIILLSQTRPGNQPDLTVVPEKDLIASHTNILGKSDAVITLVEFSDFQCPACKTISPAVIALYNKYTNHIRLAFRHFPLPQHTTAPLAAEAAQIAGEYDKFWEYTEKLFADDKELNSNELLSIAAGLNIDPVAFKEQLDSRKQAKVVEEDIRTGLNLKINATPTIFLNGTKMDFTSEQDFTKQVLELLFTLAPDVKEAQPAAPSSTVSPNPKPSGIKTVSVEDMNKKPDVTLINYTSSGFDPQTVSVNVNKKIKVVNKTDKDISLLQVTPTYSEFTKPILLKPEESLEATMSVVGLWTFKESGGNFATVYAQGDE